MISEDLIPKELVTTRCIRCDEELDNPIFTECTKCMNKHLIQTTKTASFMTGPLEIKDILKERGMKYGDFRDHAQLAQRIKDILKEGRSWKDMYDYEKEALEMVAHKIARLLNGDPHYLDSWVDIVGYTQLVVDRLNK